MKWLCISILMALSTASSAAELLSHGRFRDVAVYRPAGDVKRVVLFFSGDEGWNATVGELAQALSTDGALVAGIDAPAFFNELSHDGAECVYPAGDLENLSHFVQAYYRLPAYRAPILAGRASGGAFVYSMLAQAPSGTFAGGVSVGFCPYLPLAKPLCAGEGVRFSALRDRRGVDLLANSRLAQSWIVVRGESDRACDAAVTKGFVGSVEGADFIPIAEAEGPEAMVSLRLVVDRVAAQEKPITAVAEAMRDLPIVEVDTASDKGDTFAILLSGDGGWAGIDRALAGSLATHGIPVVGFDSLRYFWKPRTPESTASDVERLIRHYASQWNKSSVVLIGYSQGADVLPFVVNRLSASTRAQVRLVTLLGLEPNAQFEFHLSSWLGGGEEGLPIEPELERISATPVMCVFGEGESDSLCPQLSKSRVRIVRVAGGHHFGGDYERLSRLILKELPPAAVR